jgi:hypothetical protein
MSRFKDVDFFLSKTELEYKEVKAKLLEVVAELRDIEKGCHAKIRFENDLICVRAVMKKIEELCPSIRSSAVAVEQAQVMTAKGVVTEYFTLPTNRSGKNNEEERQIKQLALRFEMEEILLRFEAGFNLLGEEERQIIYFSFFREEGYAYMLANRFYFSQSYLLKTKRNAVFKLAESLGLS